ncbi:dimethyl sulfone monooxygenase SfnG [Methylovorus menthalis]|uniref:dimethylsulfone monooxygenase SfnG n=1 Tax=Methylovorus menthalis TaxID=1002227 RepID=UPI001E359F52|nr:dimethyl sulfone monooxygenase SfnG [Methylovorus menthalis]MCB4811225.1 dimethyl sulfone monooxygenase SfnG [Methylovorus menthalis]
MSEKSIKFAYWVSNLSGGQVVSDIEQATGWSTEYNIALAQTAERVGFEYALTATRFLGGYKADGQHESVILTSALLQATKKLRVIAAVLPGIWPPALLAKLATTADHLSQGRWAVNVVSGWFKEEFNALGEPWLEHDERYRRSEEFIRVLKGLWSDAPFTFKGDFYRINALAYKPQPVQRPHPEIFQGGNSKAARQMAARVSDWYFMNGGSLEVLKAQIDEVSAEAAKHSRKLKFAVNAFVIARDTEAEARAVQEDIVRLADPEAIAGFANAVKQAGLATDDKLGMWAQSRQQDLVQPNDGFKTGLIGTREQIADRIVQLRAIGIDLVLVGVLNYDWELAHFGEKIIPLVRDRENATVSGANQPSDAELDGVAV